jgi:hypothetical protein
MARPADVFEPDLIVTTDDGTESVLVVEAKLHPVPLVETERQLKQYMLAMRCPVGLLATPKKIRLYYDQYLSATEDSVKLVGEYAAPSDWAAWQQRPGSAQVGAGFEDAVRKWLEGLSTESALRSSSPDVRQAAEEYLIPALNQGVVRAARPRKA